MRRGKDVASAQVGLSARVALPEVRAGVDAAAGGNVHEGLPAPGTPESLGGYSKRISNTPLPFDISASAIDNAGNTVVIEGTTYLVMRFPFTVPLSQIWEVRALHVGMGTGPFTASQAGIFYFFSAGGRTFSGFKDSTDISKAANAGVGFYSAGQFPIYGGHGLGAIVSGYTAATVYQATASLVAFDAKTGHPILVDV